MLSIYRGQIYAVLAILSGLVGMLSIGFFFMGRSGRDDAFAFIVFIIGMGCIILGLVLAALAYVNWAPKWERDEKRTGRVLGEKERA